MLILTFCLCLVGVDSAALQTLAMRNALYEVPGLGNKPLVIKMYPAVENYQSDVYEVFAEPYNFDPQDLRKTSAIAVIGGEGENSVRGEIIFEQRHQPGPVLIKGNLTDLPAGKHGIHIHQSGDLRQGCEKLGAHFNPYLHGGPSDPIRHVGDLGNVEGGEDGSVEFSLVDPLMSLTGGPRGVVGRAVVITSNPDDLGRGGTADSLTTGDSGKPLACGVIAYIR